MAPVTYSDAAISGLYKRLYPAGRPEDLTYEDHPMLAMMPKDEGFTGSALQIPLKYANTQGRNVVFSAAQTAAQSASLKAKGFLITRVKDYQLFTLDNETLEASQDKEGAFVRMLQEETDSAYSNFAQSIAMAVWGDGTGKVGVIGSVTATTDGVITLANINDITNFEYGQSFQAAQTVGGALRNSGASAVISGIDRDLGTITFTGTITGMDAGDTLFLAGDNSGSSTLLRMSGVQAWIPTSAPSATPFFGVVRTDDVTRLGGLRFNGTGNNYEELFVAGLSRLARDGGSPTHIFLNFIDWASLKISLGSKVETEYMQMGAIGFETIVINGPRGRVRIVADRDCPAGIGFALTMKSWKLHSLNKAPHILNRDVGPLLRQASVDGWEGRLAMYAQVACNAPGHNMVFSLPT